MDRRRFMLGVSAAAGSLVVTNVAKVLGEGTPTTTLKKVLIYGDSVTSPSLGYSGFTVTQLKNLCNAAYEALCTHDDCGQDYTDTTEWVLQNFDRYFTDKAPDIIHLNLGLDVLSWMEKITITEYNRRIDTFQTNLGVIFDKLKTKLPNTLVIYATTLPTDACCAPDAVKGCQRRNSDVIAFNARALIEYTKRNIIVDDLYTYAVNRNHKRIDGRHYDATSRLEQGTFVANFLKPYLQSTASLHNSIMNSSQNVSRTIRHSDGSLEVQFAHETSGTMAELFTVHGKLLRKCPIKNHRVSLSSDIPSGTYLLKINSETLWVRM